jgi:glycosyltransferase involved in cell wall biosynthesis
MKKKISIVIPIKNEVENIPALISELNSTFREKEFKPYRVEFIVNDNFSSDGSRNLLSRWAANDARVRLNLFERDLGFQGSLITGMRLATGDVLAVLQGDLQDPPHLLLKMLYQWENGARVVAPIATNRKESFLDRLGRKIFYSLLVRSSDSRLSRDFQDFYMLDKSVYKEIAKSPINSSFIRAKISSNFGIDVTIPYERRKRELGSSNFRFVAKYNLAIDGLLFYGLKFNRILSLSSFIFCLIVIVAGTFLALSKIWGIFNPPPGWTTIQLTIMFFGALIVFLISILVEYLVRLYRITIENYEKVNFPN